MLAAKETNAPAHKSGKSPTTLSSLQQGTPLKQTGLFKRKPQMERNKVSGCTQQSDLLTLLYGAHWPPDVDSLLQLPHARAVVLLRDVVKGGASGQVVLAAARASPENSPGGAGWSQAARLLAGFDKICY